MWVALTPEIPFSYEPWNSTSTLRLLFLWGCSLKMRTSSNLREEWKLLRSIVLTSHKSSHGWKLGWVGLSLPRKGITEAHNPLMLLPKGPPLVLLSHKFLRITYGKCFSSICSFCLCHLGSYKIVLIKQLYKHPKKIVSLALRHLNNLLAWFPH